MSDPTAPSLLTYLRDEGFTALTNGQGIGRSSQVQSIKSVPHIRSELMARRIRGPKP